MSTATMPGRIAEKFDRRDGDECWLWSGAKTSAGYGHVRWDARMQYAHRVVYELLVGPIPDGLQIDHLCRVRHCVNPAHLEVVSSQENTMRGENVAARRARQTHCLRGHAFTSENTYIQSNGTRRCRTCWRDRMRRIRRGRG